MAFKGYNNSRFFIEPNQQNTIEHNRIMSRHEKVNKRSKQFNVLNYYAVVNLTRLILLND